MKRASLVVAVLLVAAGVFASAGWLGRRSTVVRSTPLPTVDGASYTGGSTTLTDGLRSFAETVRVSQSDEGSKLDRLEFDCHGGMARMVWHVGNLEPTVPDTGIHLTALLDGEPIGSLLKGSTRGIWNDAPAEIHAVAECQRGRHALEVRLEQVRGSWGIPYVVSPGNPPSPHLRVNRGFIVEEVWGEG